MSVSISENNNEALFIEETGFEELLQHIKGAEPTRKMSLNDYPTSKPYYRISIESSQRHYIYFVYEENSRVYIELPYEGIYRTDNGMLEFVLKYFEE